jgi:hypothetical protein
LRGPRRARGLSNYSYWEEYPDVQIAALWNIPIDVNHVIGHYRINQKVDPGPALNLFWTRSGYPLKPPIFDTPAP